MFPLVVLSVGAVAHTCIQEPQCVVCEQSFEACNPPPLFTPDEHIRMEYIGGSCSCNIEDCGVTETHYTFVDPATMTPVVVYNLKCCPSALHCPTTPTTAVTSASISPATTTATATVLEEAGGLGSGDGSGDAEAIHNQNSQDTGGSNGAATVAPAAFLLIGIFVL